MEDFGVIVSSISISLDIILNDNSPNFLFYFRWHVFRAHRSILDKSCSSYINGTRNFVRTIIKRGKHVAAIFEKCSKKESWIFISICKVSRFLVESISKNRLPRKFSRFPWKERSVDSVFLCWLARMLKRLEKSGEEANPVGRFRRIWRRAKL